jgi:hypothetical protein
MSLPQSACARLAEEAGEPLAGTASSDGATLFLVRFAGLWPRKALEGSDLPPALKANLKAAAKSCGGRVVLVRGPARGEDPPELYVARTVAGERFVLRFAFKGYDAMAEVDWAEVARRGTHPVAEVVDEPLFLACVHGKRDACCAAKGTALFNLMTQLRPGRVLQCSHLGGHRFAPVLLSLPDGLCYGRVAADEVHAFIEAREQGRIFDLRRLRGRMSFGGAAQAAEVFLRTALAETAIDALTLESDTRVEGGGHQVVFSAGGARHSLVVAEELTGTERPGSCGDDPKPASRFVLVDHRVS